MACSSSPPCECCVLVAFVSCRLCLKPLRLPTSRLDAQVVSPRPLEDRAYPSYEVERTGASGLPGREMSSTQRIRLRPGSSCALILTLSKKHYLYDYVHVSGALRCSMIRYLCAVVCRHRLCCSGLLVRANATCLSRKFRYAIVFSKLMPPMDHPLLDAIREDSHYCYLVPLTIYPSCAALYMSWVSLKFFRHN